MPCGEVNFSSRVHLASDPESTRFALGGVHLHPAEGCVIAAATDTRILAITRQDGYVSEECIIPKDAAIVKSNEKHCSVHISDTKCERHATDRKNSKSVTTFPLVEGRFPDYIRCVPFDVRQYARVHLNKKYLCTLLEALVNPTLPESGNITLFLNPEDKDITTAVVVVMDGNVGLIMPNTCDDNAQVETFVNIMALARSKPQEHSKTPTSTSHVSISADTPEAEPVAVVSPEVADAFDMHGLPNTIVQEPKPLPDTGADEVEESHSMTVEEVLALLA